MKCTLRVLVCLHLIEKKNLYRIENTFDRDINKQVANIKYIF